MESEKLRNRIKHTRSHVGQQAKGTFGERRLEPILFFILGLNGSAIRFPFITWCCAPLRARHLCPARCGTRSACRVRSRCAEIFFAQPTLTRRQSAIFLQHLLALVVRKEKRAARVIRSRAQRRMAAHIRSQFAWATPSRSTSLRSASSRNLRAPPLGAR